VLRLRSLLVLILIIMSYCFSPFSPLYAQDSSEDDVEETAQVVEETDDASYLLNIFENKYNEMTEKVHQGQLPATVSEEAARIRMDLKKFIISRNAELEILKLEVLEGSKQNSKAALEQMSNLVADTERNKMLYIQKLSALSPGSGSEHVATMPAQGAQSGESLLSTSKKSSATRKKSKKKQEEDSIWETKDFNKRMQIAPEDLSMGRIQ